MQREAEKKEERLIERLLLTDHLEAAPPRQWFAPVCTHPLSDRGQQAGEAGNASPMTDKETEAHTGETITQGHLTNRGLSHDRCSRTPALR